MQPAHEHHERFDQQQPPQLAGSCAFQAQRRERDPLLPDARAERGDHGHDGRRQQQLRDLPELAEAFAAGSFDPRRARARGDHFEPVVRPEPTFYFHFISIEIWAMLELGLSSTPRAVSAELANARV